MKTFKDLKFKPHRTGEGKQAVMLFPNGYGVSVVRFKIDSFRFIDVFIFLSWRFLRIFLLLYETSLALSLIPIGET